MTDREIEQAQEAVDRFLKNYDKALKNPIVRNPISYALYHTWRYYDAKRRKERERNKD